MALATNTMMVSELMEQGRQSAAFLEALLQESSPPAHDGVRDLAAQILRCLDRGLAALHGGGVVAVAAGPAAACAGKKRKSPPAGGATTEKRPKRRVRANGSGETATRVEKKWTMEDGYIWRKYGQKEIQNSKYPRLYFRCTYKHDNGCRAMKQVQQSEEDPSLYVITYFGEHTCCGNYAADAVVDDDEKMQQFVINFGSATASTASPWPSCSSPSSDEDAQTSQSPQAVCLPEGDEQELRVKTAKVESNSNPVSPAAELSSSADASCASPSYDSLLGSLDWEHFGENSYDVVNEFINFDAIPLFQFQ